MNHYIVSPEAESDLDAIDSYLASEAGDDVAERMISRIEETFELLAAQPAIGTMRPTLTSAEVLFWPIPGLPYLVVYRDTSPLSIARVWDGRRDPKRLRRALASE